MSKPSDNDVVSNKEEKDAGTASSWGTWEELILAFAVNRHGTGAWDSIASELQKRTSNPSLELTPYNCRLQYIDLKRRFAQNDVEEDGESDVVEESVPLLEELRKLRVAELRREVQRYDLKIESLESKMKKMEDEREKSRKSESDPETKNDDVTPTASTAPETRGNEPDAGEEPEKDRLSVNESNSTNSGPQKQQIDKTPHEPDRTVDENVAPDRTATEPEEAKPPAPDPKPANEDSCNGSSNSVEKEPNRMERTEPVTESIGSEDNHNNKENSDVQSEVSRSRKDEEEGSDKVRRVTASGGERGHVDEPRAVKEEIESGPLIEILKSLMGTKFGSVFSRRLKSQETAKYHKLIHQHMDFETIESRIKEGSYSNSINKFYRDLLLVVNNALVFFAKNSSETKAAHELRRLISKEITQKYARSESSSGKHISLQSLSKHEESEPSNSLALKPRLSGPLIVCRKRSSITKASSSSGTNKKKEPIEEENDAKVQQNQCSSPLSSNSDEPKVTKKRTRERFSSVSAPAKKNGKNQSNNSKATESSGKQGKGSSTSREAKNDNNSNTKKKNQTSTESKKRGAADFLNRMKQGSSPNKGDLLDALKNTPLTGGEGNSSKRGGEKREQQTNKRHVETNTQQTKEKGKKNIGRPPKRGAAAQPPPPPPPTKTGKRARGGEMETPPSKQQPKKRSRK